MKRFLVFSFLIVILSGQYPLLGKGANHLLIEAGVGLGSGWWVHKKGSLDGSAVNNYGWDHTAAKPNFILATNFLYKRNRFKIGINFNYTLLKATQMLRHDDALGYYHRYRISNKFVRLIKVGIMAEYDIFSGARYALAPHVAAGTFFINTSHPESDNFGFKWYITIGMNNDILMKDRFSLIIRPEFNVMTIWPKEKRSVGEKHHIYSLGINLGTRIKLF